MRSYHSPALSPSCWHLKKFIPCAAALCIKTWINDAKFEIVDPSVPATGAGMAHPHDEPANLDFEK